MIAPEPNWACDLSGLQPGEAGENIPVPAAGRLGATEEKCTWIHMSFALPDEDDQFICFNCGAAV